MGVLHRSSSSQVRRDYSSRVSRVSRNGRIPIRSSSRLGASTDASQVGRCCSTCSSCCPCGCCCTSSSSCSCCRYSSCSYCRCSRCSCYRSRSCSCYRCSSCSFCRCRSCSCCRCLLYLQHQQKLLHQMQPQLLLLL